MLLTIFTVCTFIKLLAFLMRNTFSETPVDALLHTLSKFYDAPIGLGPSTLLRQCLALFAVAEGWLLLELGGFVLLYRLRPAFITISDCLIDSKTKREINFQSRRFTDKSYLRIFAKSGNLINEPIFKKSSDFAIVLCMKTYLLL